jgi:hypothetical protein
MEKAWKPKRVRVWSTKQGEEFSLIYDNIAHVEDLLNGFLLITINLEEDELDGWITYKSLGGTHKYEVLENV